MIYVLLSLFTVPAYLFFETWCRWSDRKATHAAPRRFWRAVLPDRPEGRHTAAYLACSGALTPQEAT